MSNTGAKYRKPSEVFPGTGLPPRIWPGTAPTDNLAAWMKNTTVFIPADVRIIESPTGKEPDASRPEKKYKNSAAVSG